MHRWHAGIFGCSGFLGPLWEWKHRWTVAAEVRFICREEKRREEKGCMGHAAGPENWWSLGSGWKLGFIAILYCWKVEISLRCRQMFPGKEKFLGQLSPFGASWSLSFKSPLSMITLTVLRDKNEVYSVTASCWWGGEWWRGLQHQGWPRERS
jgi:hypothetical protein